jgi:hypothetical protein
MAIFVWEGFLQGCSPQFPEARGVKLALDWDPDPQWYLNRVRGDGHVSTDFVLLSSSLVTTGKRTCVLVKLATLRTRRAPAYRMVCTKAEWLPCLQVLRSERIRQWPHKTTDPVEKEAHLKGTLFACY